MSGVCGEEKKVGTADCIWSVILNLRSQSMSSSPSLFCHVPLKRDQGDCRLELNDTPNTIGGTSLLLVSLTL